MTRVLGGDDAMPFRSWLHDHRADWERLIEVAEQLYESGAGAPYSS